MGSSPAGGNREGSGACWDTEEPGGTGSEGGGRSPWTADPEEGLVSGAEACSVPLIRICCKARCRRAVERRNVKTDRSCVRVRFPVPT